MGQGRLSIGILLQRLITLLCTSHTGQCAPSLKWYKIHMVQPVPPVTLSCRGKKAGGEGRGRCQRGGQELAGTERRGAEGRPRGAGTRLQAGMRGKQEAGSASGCQRLPSCAAWARWARPCHPKGTRGWQSWCQPRWSRSKRPLLPGAVGPHGSHHLLPPALVPRASLQPRPLSWSRGTHGPCPAAGTDREERVGWEEVLK